MALPYLNSLGDFAMCCENYQVNPSPVCQSNGLTQKTVQVVIDFEWEVSAGSLALSVQAGPPLM